MDSTANSSTGNLTTMYTRKKRTTDDERAEKTKDDETAEGEAQKKALRRMK